MAGEGSGLGRGASPGPRGRTAHHPALVFHRPVYVLGKRLCLVSRPQFSRSRGGRDVRPGRGGRSGWYPASQRCLRGKPRRRSSYRAPRLPVSGRRQRIRGLALVPGAGPAPFGGTRLLVSLLLTRCRRRSPSNLPELRGTGSRRLRPRDYIAAFLARHACPPRCCTCYAGSAAREISRRRSSGRVPYRGEPVPSCWLLVWPATVRQLPRW